MTKPSASAIWGACLVHCPTVSATWLRRYRLTAARLRDGGAVWHERRRGAGGAASRVEGDCREVWQDMKTDDLIKGLAADRTTGMPMPGRRLDVALALATLSLPPSSSLARWACGRTLPRRPDRALSVQVCRDDPAGRDRLADSARAFGARRKSAQGSAALIAAPAILLAAVALELMVLPAADDDARMIGKNAMLLSGPIPAIGLDPAGCFPDRRCVTARLCGRGLREWWPACWRALWRRPSMPRTAPTIHRFSFMVWYTLAIAILAWVPGRYAAR
jgi:hypothetical protein